MIKKRIIKESAAGTDMQTLIEYVFNFLMECEFELDNEEHEYGYHDVPKDSYDFEVAQEFLDSLPNRGNVKTDVMKFKTPGGVFTNTPEVYQDGDDSDRKFVFGFISKENDTHISVSVEVSDNYITWIDAVIPIPENIHLYNINIK